MSDPSERPRQTRPRPTPRPAPHPAPHPTPGPRPDGGPPAPPADPAADPDTAVPTQDVPAIPRTRSAPPPRAARPAPRATRRWSPLARALAVLCALAAAAVLVLGWQRLQPPSVDSAVFAAARADVEALYAYDHRDSAGSVQRKLAVLTGDLRDRYADDLKNGGVIESYQRMSATTRYDVVDLGLAQLERDGDAATLVVFGRYVVASADAGNRPVPQGSQCEATADGAQSCTQIVQVRVVRVGDDWKISALTSLTTGPA